MTRPFASTFMGLAALVLAGFASVSNASGVPATQPSRPVVLVLPFNVTGANGMSWVGRSAKDDVVNGLAHGLDAAVRTPSIRYNAADSAEALKAAHEFKANYVIYGSAQVLDTDTRVTAQVLDVASGQPIGAMKVTGPINRLIDFGDILTAQAMAALPQSMVKPDAYSSLRLPSFPQPVDADPQDAQGLAMISQSYPVIGMPTIPSPLVESPMLNSSVTTTYVYAPTITVSAGYGYAGSYAPDYYGPAIVYPLSVVGGHHNHDRLPVIHHGPRDPYGARRDFGGNNGVVIAGTTRFGNSSGLGTVGTVNQAGVFNQGAFDNQTPVSFGFSGNSAAGTPFVGGGQSFPAQNGFVTVGASAGFSVNGPRFANPIATSPRGFSGRSTGR